jgi:hypothetical protein
VSYATQHFTAQEIKPLKTNRKFFEKIAPYGFVRRAGAAILGFVAAAQAILCPSVMRSVSRFDASAYSTQALCFFNRAETHIAVGGM